MALRRSRAHPRSSESTTDQNGCNERVQIGFPGRASPVEPPRRRGESERGLRGGVPCFRRGFSRSSGFPPSVPATDNSCWMLPPLSGNSVTRWRTLVESSGFAVGIELSRIGIPEAVRSCLPGRSVGSTGGGRGRGGGQRDGGSADRGRGAGARVEDQTVNERQFFHDHRPEDFRHQIFESHFPIQFVG